MKTVFILAIIGIAFYGVLIYLIVLIIKALRKYLKSNDVRKEKVGIKKSLGENLKEHRVRCKMTQEFVAESLGVMYIAIVQKAYAISGCFIIASVLMGTLLLSKKK